MIFFAVVIILKLFILQIVEHDLYLALASGQHAFFSELIPERGMISVHDYKDEIIVPIATNEQRAFVYADPRLIVDPTTTAQKIGEALSFSEEQVSALIERLDQPEDPYEPIARDVSDETLQRILALELSGIAYVREWRRLYPEPLLGGHVSGFLGMSEDKPLGQYGIEGYFDELLVGASGFLRSEKDIAGRLITVGNTSIEPAKDGADIVLTIDRTIQFKTCRALKSAIERHSAEGGSVVIVEPSSGQILAMCGAPDFDPNNYSDVEAIDAFNNPAIFQAYEPGSIFKPVTMAAAIDAGAVNAGTTFEDTGSVLVQGWPKPLGNAQGKMYGVVNMTQVLEDSINTGMVFAMRQTGQETFVEYVKRFGFGETTGVELDTEVSGTIASLENAAEIYAATASFGQGITVTPLQIAMAYAAIANGGMLKRPHIVDEIHHPDGTIEKKAPEDIAQIMDPKTARILGAMLVSVIEHGHGKRAGVSGYYIAGKTGTAQVARRDGIGYDEASTIGSFAGFGPVENPKFVMVVRIDNPKDVVWAESTAAPLFGELAEFLLEYFEVAPVRK